MMPRTKGVLRYCILVLGIGLVWTIYFLRTHLEPLGEPRQIVFPEAELSAPDRLRFLDGDFRIITNLRDLPKPIREALREEGGTRMAMVNPGQRFEATDVIIDPSLPNRRLIFAGIEGDRVFVHYEQGGIAHMSMLALLRLSQQGGIQGVSRDFCGPARDLQSLRSEIERGDCNQPVPREMR